MAGTHSLRRLNIKIILASCFAVALFTFVSHNFTTFIQLQRTYVNTKNETNFTTKNQLQENSSFGNIFFLETSGSGTLSFRQSASVESAARFIPHSNIIVFMITHHDVIYTPVMTSLEEVYDVEFKKTTAEDLIKNTPVEEWYKTGVLQKSPYRVSHTSDVLRYTVIWKYGGIYLDLDVYLLKEWIVRSNTVIRETQDYLVAGILAFKKNHTVMLDCLNWISRNYNPGIWNIIGPALITQVVSSYQRNNSSAKDIITLESNTFFEIRYFDWKLFFEEKSTDTAMRRLSSSIGTHVWNQFSKNLKLNPKSVCAYFTILRKSSPMTYSYIIRNDTGFV